MSTVTPLRPPRVELDADGKLVRAWVPSFSEPGKEYELIRMPGGAWAHTDASCRGWVEYGRCVHVTALELFMADDETRITTVQVNPLALLNDLDLETVMSQKLIPSEKHMYTFRQKGELVEGVSIDGVRDAARALSTQGEAIRELWVHLEREDERDAYFVACAARYAVAPDGKEICMDTTIRAKRQPKWGKKREGGEYFIEAWFEIGVAKAVRNATEALLPEALKQHIMQTARELLRARNGNTPPPEQPQSAPTARTPSAGPAGKPIGGGVAITQFWKAAKALGFEGPAVIAIAGGSLADWTDEQLDGLMAELRDRKGVTA